MADDRAKIVIDADTQGLVSEVKNARESVRNFGASLQDAKKPLKDWDQKILPPAGEALKKFSNNLKDAGADTENFSRKISAPGGKNLHGSIDSLEMPLRDVEGSFDRVSMATRVWGNASETASEKATVGFLLVADSIATLGSGGVAGLAIAAGVAAFAMLSQVISKQAEESKKAEEATKKQAEALQELAKSAAQANVTVALLNAQQAEKSLRAKVRAADHERRILKTLFNEQTEEFNKLIDQRDSMQNGKARSRLVRLIEAESKRLNIIKTAFEKVDKIAGDASRTLKEAHDKVAEETLASNQNAITKLINFLDVVATESTKVIEKETKKRAAAVETFAQLMTRAAESDKARTEAQQAMRKESEDFDKRLAEKNKESLQLDADFESAVLAAKVQDQEDAALAILGINERTTEAQSKLSQDMAKSEEMRAKAVSSSYKAAASAVTNELFNMAKAGEFSFGKLAEAATMAAGQSLVSEGTRVLLVGISKLFNPITFPVGVAESKHGSIMIGAGLAMGAIGGAVSRSSETPTASGGASSTPTDTRQSRAASTTAEGGGGTTIITFNGPAYDRRGVSEVITSGQRMARHRRIAGA